MKLAKALKYKNRLVKKISTVQRSISSYNSVEKGSTKEVDVSLAMGEYKKFIKELVELKIKMFEASRPIREHILKLAELKAEISWLREIPTLRGQARVSSYMRDDGEAVEYEAVFSRQEINKMIEDNEEQIDSLQEEIDTFNHTTEID